MAYELKADITRAEMAVALASFQSALPPPIDARGSVVCYS